MKFLKKGSKVSVEEVNTSSGLEYDIKFDAGGQAGEITVAKCWDYLLAEKLRDAVSEYMAEEYKVVGQEDAEMLEEAGKATVWAVELSDGTERKFKSTKDEAKSKAEEYAKAKGLEVKRVYPVLYPRNPYKGIFREEFDKPIMPDTAVAGKPIAVKMVRTEDPKEAFTLHSLRDCIDDFEKEVFTKVMTTGKPYDGYDTVAVPVLQRGVPKKYQPLLSKFSESKKVNESVDGEPWPEEELKKLDNYIVDAKLAISQATSFIEGNASSGLDSMEEVWTHLNSTYNDLGDIQDMIH